MKLPVAEDAALLPSLLTVSDVLATGHHCAVKAGIGPGTSVTVIGDGAVGLSAVLAARRLGAEQIVLIGSHKARTDLGRGPGSSAHAVNAGDTETTSYRQNQKGFPLDLAIRQISIQKHH